MLKSQEVLRIYQAVKNESQYNKRPVFEKNPLWEARNGVRTNSVSIYDTAFGDSGKGAVTAKLNRILNKEHTLFSLSPNGGRNAGHEAEIDGRKIVTHQLPMAVVEAGATALMTRGKVLDPIDLIFEIAEMENNLGSQLPGDLIIDERVPLNLDTHRGLETALNAHSTGGRGSTKSGISPSYASVYERIAVTAKDLLAEKWEETFRSHYRLYESLTRGFGEEFTLANLQVRTLDPDRNARERTIGSENEFIGRLAEVRHKIRRYVSANVYNLLEAVWKDERIPVTIEAAQAAGLDPYHGVYPDNTGSRPITRAIGDATYGVMNYQDIALKTGVSKTVYMSSVGIRRLPTKMDAAEGSRIREGFSEFGKTTGRSRDIYEIPIPLLQYLRRADGYEYLIATHLDAASDGIDVITHYRDKITGDEAPYLPYQDHLDNLEPNVVHFKGWDGEAVKQAKSVAEFPPELLQYLNFLSMTVAPVAIGTTGPDLASYVSWLPWM